MWRLHGGSGVHPPGDPEGCSLWDAKPDLPEDKDFTASDSTGWAASGTVAASLPSLLHLAPSSSWPMAPYPSARRDISCQNAATKI